MTKAYDSFVLSNPKLFKITTLDLFVKVGFLSKDIYEVAKQAIEEYQTELSTKNKEVEQPVRQQDSEVLSSSASNVSQFSENTELSSEEPSTKQTTTIV